MKHIFWLILIILCVACSPDSPSINQTVVLVVPLPHKSMDDIEAGFKESLQLPHVKVRVLNAQGDPNLMRTIFQQLKQQHVDAVLPIGTSATQMARLMLPNDRIVGLAADVKPDADACRFSVVDDEISRKKQMEFIAQLYPKATRWVVLHSADDKVYLEVDDMRRAAKQLGIEMKSVLVLNLMELQNVLTQLSSDTQGLFILKDHLLVSAVPALKQYANQHHVPLVTSDEGSITEGGDVALGIREKDIGRTGAVVLKNMLKNKQTCIHDRIVLDQLTVFMRTSLPVSEQNRVRAVARDLRYAVEVVSK